MGSRRLLAAALSIALVGAACTTRSGRQTALPPIPDTLSVDAATSQGGCLLTVGDGLGASVTDVLPGTPAIGAIDVDDLIVAVDGTAVRDAGDLVDVVGTHGIGDRITVTLQRSGEHHDVAVTLAESSEVAGRPILGVLVSTVENRLPPVEVGEAGHTVTNPASRIVALDGDVWLLDGTTATWERVSGFAAPGGPFVPIGDEIYTLQASDDLITLVAVRSGTSTTIDIGEWQTRIVLTSMGGRVLVAAERPDATRPTGFETAVIAIDPVTGAAVWAWVPDQSSDAYVPAFAFNTIESDQAIVALTPPGDLSSTRYVILFEDDQGSPSVVTPLGLPENAVVVGWFDDRRVLSIISSIADGAITDPFTGESESTSLQLAEIPAGMWTVGDGEHLLVADSESLQIIEVGGPDRRTLATDCGLAVLGEWGYST